MDDERLERRAHLRDVFARRLLEYLSRHEAQQYTDRDAAHPAVFLGVDRVEQQSKSKREHPRPLAVMRHRLPPLRLERLTPGRLDEITGGQADEEVLEQPVDAVLPVDEREQGEGADG